MSLQSFLYALASVFLFVFSVRFMFYTERQGWHGVLSGFASAMVFVLPHALLTALLP